MKVQCDETPPDRSHTENSEFAGHHRKRSLAPSAAPVGKKELGTNAVTSLEEKLPSPCEGCGLKGYYHNFIVTRPINY